jgi:predicted enzyme related to lactoylglutathione lyase
MPRVVHFEIPADNPQRAVKFYQTVFNWKIEKWAGPIDYWLVTTGGDKEPGINGAITSKANLAATTNTVDVPSVDDFVKKITAAGGKVVMPKRAVPGQGYLAYCADTEGNVFGVFKSDPSAE